MEVVLTNFCTLLNSLGSVWRGTNWLLFSILTGVEWEGLPSATHCNKTIIRGTLEVEGGHEVMLRAPDTDNQERGEKYPE